MKDATSRRGAEAIEFALIVPVMVLLTAGLVDYSWFYNLELAVIDAARHGGRAGAATMDASDNTPCQVAEAATLVALEAAGIPGVDNTRVSAWVAQDGADGDGDGVNDGVVYVDVRVPYVPLWGLVINPSELHGALAMRMEDQEVGPCGPL